MFTGIIETLGRVAGVEKEGGNLHLHLEADIANDLQIDQSLAHNGVCLTVVDTREGAYTVTAIGETLRKTNLGLLEPGSIVNLERAMVLGDRLDGHLVQGHVDQTGTCTAVEEKDGSWLFRFSYDPSQGNLTIKKGSITIDGTSLTIVDSERGSFSVAIIPYTYEHTCFHTYRAGTVVNLEFDMIGKYVARLLATQADDGGGGA
jgi:riboflavin synthase